MPHASPRRSRSTGPWCANAAGSSMPGLCRRTGIAARPYGGCGSGDSADEAVSRQLISSAPGKGIRGGTLYDALHAQTARLCGCREIHTLNVAHFKHVAPDLTVVGL